MNSTRALTPFQQDCEAALRAELARTGLALVDRTVAGESETYVRASVRDTDIEVYIYEDEAQFHRRGERVAGFEHQDFGDATELQKAFVSGVIAATQDI